MFFIKRKRNGYNYKKVSYWKSSLEL